MLRKFKFVLILGLSFLSSLSAQQNDNNPYSRFGIGDITDNNFNHLRQMGGLGASFIDAYHINIVNPASLAYLNSAAFDVGVFAKRSILDDGKNSGKTWSGNLDYLSLAFPLRNPINEVYDAIKKDYKFGMAITLMPHSNVDYNIAYRDSVDGSKPFTRNFLGGGGSYKVMWGNAFKYKKVSIGANLGYLFGNLKYENKLIFDNAEFAYNDFYANDYNVRGFLWNAGVIFTDIINKKKILANKTTPSKRISVGAHFNSGTSFTTSSNINHLLIQQLPGNVVNFDTVNVLADAPGKGKLPSEFGVGATYYNGEKFAIGINYASAIWSEYFNEAARETKGTLSNTSKWSLGGFFRPDYKSFDNFFERVYYRYGVYYNTDPRVIEGKSIDTYGVTFGLGMPFVFQRKISHVNLGVNAGIRGQNAPISERFVKFTLGVTFNDDEWFLKRKYN